VGTTFAGFALLGAIALTLRTRRVFVPELVLSALGATATFPSRLGAAFTGARRIVVRTRLGRVSLLPIVVPFGLCAIFLGVFALANPVVAHGITIVGGWIERIGCPSPLRIALWCVAFIAAVVAIRPAIRIAPSAGEERAPSDGEATPTGLLVARNALALLNVLFVLYEALDATYLWCGHPPNGMTTQEYSHEGAFWLTIALAMLTAVVGVMFRGVLAHDPRAALARKLAYVWMGQGFIIAIGSYRRIGIHVAYSGLSDLRIVGMLGTTLVVLGVALVAYKLQRIRTFGWLLRRQLDAFAVTAILYFVTPTHAIAARYNVARIEAGELRPVLHLFRQSREVESATALARLLTHPDPRLREGVAVLLDRERERLEIRIANERSWREHDVLSQTTLAALDHGKMDLILSGLDQDRALSTLRLFLSPGNDDRVWSGPSREAADLR
jgi:hypothetical protein